MYYFYKYMEFVGASHVMLVLKNPPANVGGTRETGSIPALGRSSGV